MLVAIQRSEGIEKLIHDFLFFLRFWIEGIFLSVVGCIGIMGNLISLHILRKDSMRKTSFDEMLTHLLILDTIMVIFFLLDHMTTNVFGQTDGQTPDWYKILYPYVIHPGKAIFVSATVFMVVAVSADRQRAICHSMLYRVISQSHLILLMYIKQVEGVYNVHLYQQLLTTSISG